MSNIFVDSIEKRNSIVSMNTELPPDLKAELEFLELLKRTCRTTRNSRNRPDLAIPAGQWEIRINSRLDEIHALETPQLPLNSKQKVAA